VISGKHIGVDRSIIEQLIEPLTHLLRNAVDHGIEKPEVRKSKGKDPRGLIRLTVSHERSDIVIEIRDDGRGIAYDEIRAIIDDMDIVDDVDKLTREQIHKLMLSENLSTKTEATEVSGRGVGLTTIKQTVDNFGGDIEIDSVPGKYTTFKLIIPLSVAITKVLLLTVKQQQFAIPMTNIQQIISVPQDQFYGPKGSTTKNLVIDEEPVPCVDLRDRFQFNINPDQVAADSPGLNSKKLYSEEVVVLWKKGNKRLGFIVDDLLGERDVVMKPIHNFLAQIGAFSSATVLEGGKVVLIIDPMNFLEVGINA